MKIGLVRRGYSPTGGAERYLRRLADTLAAAGHEAILFAGPEWPAADWSHARVLVSAGGPRSFADQVSRLADQHCDRLLSLERVWRCDGYRAGDGVHCAWLERRRRLEAPWRRWLRFANSKHRQILALERSLFAGGGAGTIIANSQMVRAEIQRWYGTPPEKIAVVYNGLPPDSFGPPTAEERARARASFGLDANDYAVLFAGTGWERKGLAHLVAAMNLLPSGTPARLLVAGRGRPQPYIRSMTQPVRAQTTFLGPVSDMPPLYAAADLFVAPTLYDPFSNACLEALAQGLPVLTTDANGFAEIIEQGTDGEVFAAGGFDGGKTLATLLSKWADPSKRQDAREACATKATGYSIEKNVTQTLSILLKGT